MVIILNFKTYLESVGENAIKNAQIAYDFAQQYSQHKIIICPQLLDIQPILSRFSQTSNFEVWSQHVDFQRGDKETGYTTVDSLQAIGVKGALLNHAEHKITDLSQYVEISKEFNLCLCIADILELGVTFGRYPEFNPTYVAYEPPALIGGDVSVATANSHDIEDIIIKYSACDVLVGAGVKKHEDMVISEKLGAKGVILASGFVFAADKELFLRSLVLGTA